jgi:hypothetical protein
MLKINIEADTDPPGGFETESRCLLQPIPLGLRFYRLPDLFAGELHAVLCRKWESRMKGRDWCDLVWHAARHPRVNLGHEELSDEREPSRDVVVGGKLRQRVGGARRACGEFTGGVGRR